jgi:23S rRNA (pseudouridine1915-N3)-methyltransferase
MKITIIAINKFENSAQREIFDEYVKRMRGVELKEIEFKRSKNLPPEIVKEQEGELILKNCSKNSILIALDEFGKQYSSVDFAKMLADFSLNGDSNIDFVIGGAYGLSTKILQKARCKISLGKMTFAHLMVRHILIEQIYRAKSINSSHPYHKA